jgi:dTDP-glucose 4,6-dehydratase
MSNTKIQRELGFKPEETLESGLMKTLDWYLEHEDWWRKLIDARYREWVKEQYKGIVSI